MEAVVSVTLCDQLFSALFAAPSASSAVWIVVMVVVLPMSRKVTS